MSEFVSYPKKKRRIFKRIYVEAKQHFSPCDVIKKRSRRDSYQHGQTDKMSEELTDFWQFLLDISGEKGYNN